MILNTLNLRAMDQKAWMILWTQDFAHRCVSHGSFHPMDFHDHHASLWAQLGGAFSPKKLLNAMKPSLYLQGKL